MKYTIEIPYAPHCCYVHTLLGTEDYQIISHEGIIEMVICKKHDHKYMIKCFFYKTKIIISWQIFKTKKELYEYIQKLLQKELYDVIQK